MPKKSKTALSFAIFLLLAVLGSGLILFIVKRIKDNEIEKRQTKLEEINQLAVTEFTESLNVFVAYMSGIRSYVKNADHLPSQTELFDFTQFHLKDLNSRDSTIISYLSPDHEFLYSFDRSEINPSGLVGTSVKSLRDELEIERLNELMEDEEFHLFTPLNLVEGWAGVPLNFNVVRGNESIGYIASILSTRSLIDPIYGNDFSNEFLFSFQIGDEVYFDREIVHDSSRIYHKRTDSLFILPETLSQKYIYTDFNLYGLPFKIGTAYRNDAESDNNIATLVYAWFIMIFLFGLNAFYRLNTYRKLNYNLDMTLQALNYQHDLLNKKNQELIDSNNSKDKIFSIIGHDLKAPLSSIQSVIQLIGNKTLTRPMSQEMMAKLEPVVVHASGLLDRLLKWAMVNSGKIETKPELINLFQVCKSVEKLLAASCDQKRISIQIKVNKNIEVYADYNMLTFIVRNIVANALKFSDENSGIKMEAHESHNCIRLNISDSGIGMDTSQLDSIFEVNDSKIKAGTNGERGSGLGLVMVKEFADMNNISIQAKSKSNAGTTFSLIFK